MIPGRSALKISIMSILVSKIMVKNGISISPKKKANRFQFVIDGNTDLSS